MKLQNAFTIPSTNESNLRSCSQVGNMSLVCIFHAVIPDSGLLASFFCCVITLPPRSFQTGFVLFQPPGEWGGRFAFSVVKGTVRISQLRHIQAAVSSDGHQQNGPYLSLFSHLPPALELYKPNSRLHGDNDRAILLRWKENCARIFIRIKAEECTSLKTWRKAAEYVVIFKKHSDCRGSSGNNIVKADDN